MERNIDDIPLVEDEETNKEAEAELGELLQDLVNVHLAAKFGNGT